MNGFFIGCKRKTTGFDVVFLPVYFEISDNLVGKFDLMNVMVFHIIFYAQFFVALLSFIFSLRLINNNNVPRYMRWFYIYPCVAFVVSIPIFLNLEILPNWRRGTSLINNVSLLFHFSFLGKFIINVFPKREELKFINLIFWFFFGLIFFSILSNDIFKQNNLAFSISSLGLTIFCLIHYYQLFNNIPTFDLRKEPSFWIVTGVFFSMGSNIPIFATVDYLKSKIPYGVLLSLNNTIFFCYIIMHLFFIKAYLCAIPPRKV